VIILDDAQVWTTIGVLGATLVGMITLVVTLLMRTMRAEFGAIRAEFGAIRAEFGAIRAEFARVHDRLDHLDRDVNALMKHSFGVDRE